MPAACPLGIVASFPLVFVPWVLLLIAVAQAADNDTTSGGTVAYVGMSASVIAPASHFDRDVFLQELSSAAVVDARRLDVVTFYPSSNASLTIVDFVVLQDDAGTAVSVAARILTTSVETERLVIETIIADPSVVYTPPNITLATLLDASSTFSSRDPKSAPQLVMWVCTALWLLFAVGYLIFHRLVALKDRRLYLDMYPPLDKPHACFMLVPTKTKAPDGGGSDPVPDNVAAPAAVRVIHLDEPLGCIAAGTRHVCFTTAKGVFVWGENSWGQLGLATVSSFEQLPPRHACGDEDGKEDSFFLPAIPVEACNSHRPPHAYFGWELTADSGALVCQAVRHWQLEDAAMVHSVACGAMHTLWWTNEGVFACGSNAHGQLGIVLEAMAGGGTNKPFGTDVVPALQKIDDALLGGGAVLAIAAGAYHSAVLTTAGVYVFGNNHDGQLLRATRGHTSPSHRTKVGVQRVALERICRDLSLDEMLQDNDIVSVAAIACLGGRTVVQLASGVVICNTTTFDDAFLRMANRRSSSSDDADHSSPLIVIPGCAAMLVANNKLVLRREADDGTCCSEHVVLHAAAHAPSDALNFADQVGSDDAEGCVAGVGFLLQQGGASPTDAASLVAAMYLRTTTTAAAQTTLPMLRNGGMRRGTAVRVALQRHAAHNHRLAPVDKDGSGIDGVLEFTIPKPHGMAENDRCTTSRSTNIGTHTVRDPSPVVPPTCTVVALPQGQSLVML